MELHEVEKDQIVAFQHVTLGYIVGRVLQVSAWQDGMISIINNPDTDYACEVFAYAKDITIHDEEAELKRKIWQAETDHREICRMITNLYGQRDRSAQRVNQHRLNLKKFKRDAKNNKKNKRDGESKG